MRECRPGKLRPQWVEVAVLRDYWLALNVGASEAWPRRLDYADLLIRLDDYVQGLGPMDRPGWLEARGVVEAAIWADNAEEAWNDVIEYLAAEASPGVYAHLRHEDLEDFLDYAELANLDWADLVGLDWEQPEQAAAADHLLYVALDLERGPWFVSAANLATRAARLRAGR
jgi:hypothetical protein